MTKGFDVKLDVCAYQLRTFDGEISCRLGQRSQPGLIPGREASRVQLLRQAEPAGFNSRQGAMRSVQGSIPGDGSQPGLIPGREASRVQFPLDYTTHYCTLPLITMQGYHTTPEDMGSLVYNLV